MLISFGKSAIGATETFYSGSLIINMGITPQTLPNGLKPYGLVYDLIKNQDVVVKWIINPSKVKDGIDFTYNGISYRGGTFVVPAEYRNAAVNALIASWQAKGVVVVTTATTINLDVTLTLGAIPKWALDPHEANFSKKFFERADIPATAYYYRTPPMLNLCDDIFVSPHEDAKWKTYGNLFFWNLNAKGSIWAGGKTAHTMESDKGVNPANSAQNLKFLTTLGLFKDPKKGTPPYTYINVADPVFQMMGLEDDAHNGHDQIFLPDKPGNWYPGVKMSNFDPTHQDIPSKSNGPAAATVYGRGFNDNNRGYVMYQGGHDIGGNNPDEVSAQREFFNWAFFVTPVKSPTVTYTNIPASMMSSQLYNNLTATPSSPVGMVTFTYKWYSTIGGTFSSRFTAVTNYTPPVVGAITPAVIYCKITDGCGRSIIKPVNITIIPPGVQPVVVNDTIRYVNLCSAASRTINVLTNDYDINGNMVNSITFIGGGNHGTFVNNGNGSVTYTPGWLFQGIDTMRYEVCDSTPLCSQGTIVVTTPSNGVCNLYQYLRTDTAQADSVQFQNSITNPNEAIGNYDAVNGSNSLTAQYNSDNDSIILRLDATINAGDTVRIRMAADNGTCIDLTASGSLTAGGFVPGVNSVDFNIPGASAKIHNFYNFIVTAPTRYVKITIKPTGCSNQINLDAMRANYRYCTSAVPIAIDDAISTGKNSAVTSNVKTNDSDPQNQPLSVSIVSNPTHGTAGVNGAGNIIYTPDSGYVGTDQLIYKLCNSSCLCDTAFVTYTIIDNPCSSSQIGTFISGNVTSVPSSSNTTTPNDAIGIADASNGSNALSAVINNIVNANVVLDMTDTIAALDTIVIRMAPDNASANTITVQGNLTNAWGSPTTTTVFNLPAANNRIFANYKFIVTAQTRFVRVIQTGVIAAVDVDAASFDFWNCANIPNRPPVANDDTITTYANRAVSKNVVSNDADPEGSSLSISVINPLASNGNAIASGAVITYTPNFGFTGVDTVTYKLCDSGTPSLCDTAIFIITTDPGPPVAMTDNSNVNSGSPVLVNVQLNDTLAVNAFTYTTSLMPSILSASNGAAILVGNSIQYTPNAGFTGIDSLAYELCDNDSPAASCDTAMLYITVNNQAPVANADTITTSACNAVILDVISNDTDPENGSLTVTSVSVPSSGSAVISNNQIVYTPVSSPVFTGVATFTYQVCDNGIIQQCVNGNVSVTVNTNNPPSNPPLAISDIDSTFINESIPIAVLDNDSDPDLDSLRVDSLASGLLAPSIGTIQYIANDQIEYTPNTGVMGVDSFEYKVCDIHNSGAGCINILSSCTITKVYVTISNRPPAANDDQFSTIDTFAITNSVAANDDIEPDGQAMSFSLINNPAFGSVVLDADGMFTYTPDGVYLGDVSFEYLVCDDVTPAMCDTALVTISISSSNVPPNALADTILTFGVTPYSGNVGTNDSDPNGNLDPNGFTMLSGTVNGDIIFNNDGSFTYTAGNGFIGTEYVFYEVCDSGNPLMCSTATLNIIVSDQAPVIINDTVFATEDLTLNVNAASGILSNGDIDPNGTTLSVDTTPIVNTSHGVVSVSSNGSFTFIPDVNYNGSDFFVVDVCDSTALCTADTVLIIINPVNDQVIIVNDTNSTLEDTPLNGNILTAGDYDIDTTSLKVNIVPVANPLHGGIVIDTLGNYTYTPSLNYNGSDFMVFNVCDRGTPLPATCKNDTLFITVNPVNDAPVLANDANTTNEDTPVSGTVLTVADVDPDSTLFTANTTAVSGPTNGIIIINANGSYTYTPNTNFNGIDQIVISICDAGTPMPSSCVNDTLIITVNPVNDSAIVDNETISTNEDTPVNGDLTDAGDSDPDTTALTANTIPVVAPSNGNIIINANGTYTYTPASDFNGTDLVVVSICDAGTPMPSICVNDSIFITVNPVNDAPVPDNDVLTINEDIPGGGDVTDAGDIDPDTTILTANSVPVVAPSNGSILINGNGTYVYTPNLNFNGTDLVVISVCDAGTPMPSSCVNDTLIITVNPVNDPPIIENDTISTNEDNPAAGNILTVGDYDIDTTALDVNTSPVSGPNNGGFIINNTGSYTYTPGLNFTGVDTIVLSVCDNGSPMPSICVNDTLIIYVNTINDPPTISNDTAEVDEDSNVSGTVISGLDSDLDGSTLTADTVPVSGPSNGTISININGTYLYTPLPNFNGDDVVIINICDNGIPSPVICVPDTILFTVHPVNDAPIILNDTIITNEETLVNGNILTASDYDIDTTALTVDTIPVNGPSHGSIVIDSLGSFAYIPFTQFVGVDTIVLSVCDNGRPLPSICVNDTLFVIVNPVNDNIVVINDTVSTLENIPVSGTILTSGDYDPDTTALSVNTVSVYGPGNGVIIMNSNGSYNYTPNALFNGTDTAVFNVCDSGNPLPATCDNDTLFITVINVNNTPLISNDTISTNEDNPANGTVIDGSDSDPDGSALSADVIPVAGPFHGNILINPNGSYTYNPVADYFGIDTVVISICDSGIPLPAICVNDTLIITINPVNDTPLTVNDSSFVCSNSNIQASPLTNDSDIDQDSIFISTIVQPSNGLATTDGVTITYTPVPGFIGIDSVDYTICDNGSPQLCSSGKIYFTVDGITSTGISHINVLCINDSTGSVTTAPVGNSPFTFLWSTFDTTQNISNVTAGLYSVVITDSFGCSRTDTTTVQQPASGITSGVTITDAKCFGDSTGSATLIVNGGTPPYVFQWSNGDINQDLIIVPANTYSVKITDANGCTQTNSAVISQPSAALSLNATITSANCLANANGLIDVTVSGGTPGYSYSWNNGQTTQDLSEIAGSYTITAVDTNNCSTSSVFLIDDVSGVVIISSASNNFCEGITTILSSSVTSGTFQWYRNGGLIPGATDSIYATGQSGNYSLVLNHGCGGFTSNTLPIVVKPLPVLNISVGDTICEGESTQMIASGALNYLWSPSINLNNPTIRNPFASPLTTTTYTVTGSTNGCSKDTFVTITVDPTPTVNVVAGNYDCQLGAQLLATGGINYVWSPAIGLDSINSPNPIATPGATTMYFVTVTNSFMCTSTNTVMVHVDCDTVIIPDGFSPDGDGINDILVIEGIEKFPGNSLSVFNRWGNIIYEKDNYDNSWDAVALRNGIIIGEGKVPSGTYFYVLNLGEGEKTRSGYFIIRY